ncbi:uncharacterized protein BXZ73DRAFT_82976 [Epithele typhae]|uniref:uncharacterized protein n=1 Tax=Epithele typhae TaxID=378194 RepID=UPI002008797D|nr:uncharacterized protein BXZ73DRAFT_82976 [Epithele typhae]KAH9911128.1 hypothetical protein BXZ73DRAFT_82976 [Epithele typhae]
MGKLTTILLMESIFTALPALHPTLKLQYYKLDENSKIDFVEAKRRFVDAVNQRDLEHHTEHPTLQIEQRVRVADMQEEPIQLSSRDAVRQLFNAALHPEKSSQSAGQGSELGTHPSFKLAPEARRIFQLPDPGRSGSRVGQLKRAQPYQRAASQSHQADLVNHCASRPDTPVTSDDSTTETTEDSSSESDESSLQSASASEDIDEAEMDSMNDDQVPPGYNEANPPPPPPVPPPEAPPAAVTNLMMSAAQFGELVDHMLGVGQRACAPRPHVAQPDNFDGTRANFRSFVSQIQRMMGVQPPQSDAEYIGIVLSYFRGPAVEQWVATYMDGSPPFFCMVWFSLQ